MDMPLEPLLAYGLAVLIPFLLVALPLTFMGSDKPKPRPREPSLGLMALGWLVWRVGGGLGGDDGGAPPDT